MRYRSGRPGLLLASALAAAVAALLLGVHVRRAIPLVHTAAPPAAGVSLLLVGPTPALPAPGAPQSGAPQGAVCPATPATRATATPPQVSQAPPQAQAAEVVGQVGGTLSALAVRGDTAYAVLGSRLAVLDVSVSGAPVATNGPRLLGQSAPLSHPASSLALAGNYAYLAAGDAGVLIVDVAQPDCPVESGAFATTSGSTTRVILDGGYTYVAEAGVAPGGSGGSRLSGGGLRVLDLGDPVRPAEVAFFTPPPAAGGVWDVAVAGGHLYLSGADGLRVLDVADPARPVEVGFFAAPDASPSGALGLAVAGRLAYLVRQSGRASLSTLVLDVSDASAPVQAGLLTGQTYGVTPAGDLAYVNFTTSVQIMDVRDPAHPARVGVYAPRSDAGARSVLVDGTRVFVPIGDELHILDVCDPTQPRPIAVFEPSLSVQRVAADAADAKQAYVASYRAMGVVDVADPARPALLGTLRFPFRSAGDSTLVTGLAAAGQRVYVALGGGNQPSELRIVDVSNPTAPREIGAFATPRGISSLAVAGRYAYLGEYGGLEVVDVADPAHPAARGFAPTPGSAHSLALSARHAWVVDEKSGLHVIDVGDPAHPVEVAADGRFLGPVTVAGHYLYTANAFGLRVIDVADPTALRDVAYGQDLPGLGVVVRGGAAYEPDALRGGRESPLRVLDVTDPAAPQNLGLVEVRGRLQGVAAPDGLFYTAGGGTGLWLVRLPAPQRTNS